MSEVAQPTRTHEFVENARCGGKLRLSVFGHVEEHTEDDDGDERQHDVEEDLPNAG